MRAYHPTPPRFWSGFREFFFFMCKLTYFLNEDKTFCLCAFSSESHATCHIYLMHFKEKRKEIRYYSHVCVSAISVWVDSSQACSVHLLLCPIFFGKLEIFLWNMNNISLDYEQYFFGIWKYFFGMCKPDSHSELHSPVSFSTQILLRPLGSSMEKFLVLRNACKNFLNFFLLNLEKSICLSRSRNEPQYWSKKMFH